MRKEKEEVIEELTEEQEKKIKEELKKLKPFTISIIVGAVICVLNTIFQIYDYFNLDFLSYIFIGLLFAFCVVSIIFAIKAYKALKVCKEIAKETDNNKEDA